MPHLGRTRFLALAAFALLGLRAGGAGRTYRHPGLPGSQGRAAVGRHADLRAEGYLAELSTARPSIHGACDADVEERLHRGRDGLRPGRAAQAASVPAAPARSLDLSAALDACSTRAPPLDGAEAACVQAKWKLLRRSVRAAAQRPRTRRAEEGSPRSRRGEMRRETRRRRTRRPRPAGAARPEAAPTDVRALRWKAAFGEIEADLATSAPPTTRRRAATSRGHADDDVRGRHASSTKANGPSPGVLPNAPSR